MKILFSMMFLFFVFPVHAQPPTAPPINADTSLTNLDPVTKLGKFFARKGQLVQSDSKDLGKIGGMGSSQLYVTAIAAFDPRTPTDKNRGFALYFYDRRQDRPFTDQYEAFIDEEEAENLLKSITFIADTSEQWQGKDLGIKRIDFRGTDNYRFRLEHYQDLDGEQKQRLVAFAGIIRETRVTFKSAGDISRFAQALSYGLTWLKQQ